MESPDLKLVDPPPDSGPDDVPGSRTGAALLGVLVVSCALAATLLGADRARRTFPAGELARDTYTRMLELGPTDPEIRAALVTLRREIGRRPLDARTRAFYAGLLLELADDPDQARAAAFHASRAATLAPVTVPVIRAAARILSRCGERDQALALTREMFGYDPESAAGLLVSLEPFLPVSAIRPGEPDGVVPSAPDAWLSWVDELRRHDRVEESDAWLDGAYRRWPDHIPIVQALASRAVRRGDWRALAEALPAEREIPEERSSAVLFAYRARLKAETGDPAGARRDADKAETLSNHGTSILVHVGDALLAAGDPGGARRSWNRALFDLPRGDERRPSRLALMVRLARLEDDHGEPAGALRAWRAVLAESPGHVEARRQVAALMGAEGS